MTIEEKIDVIIDMLLFQQEVFGADHSGVGYSKYAGKTIRQVLLELKKDGKE